VSDPLLSRCGGRANLFTADFMGSDNGDIGAPFPDFESTEGSGHTLVWQSLSPGPPVAPPVLSDHDVLLSTDGLPNNQQQQYPAFRQALEGKAHDPAHG
jgi:hypothetical protein